MTGEYRGHLPLTVPSLLFEMRDFALVENMQNLNWQ